MAENRYKNFGIFIWFLLFINDINVIQLGIDWPFNCNSICIFFFSVSFSNYVLIEYSAIVMVFCVIIER